MFPAVVHTAGKMCVMEKITCSQRKQISVQFDSTYT